MRDAIAGGSKAAAPTGSTRSRRVPSSLVTPKR